MKRIIVVVACMLVLVSGCTTLVETPSDTTPATEPATQTEVTHNGTAPYGVARVYIDDFSEENGTVSLQATVDFRAPMNRSLNETTFEDVMLCLYDDSGTILNSTVIGDLKTPEDKASKAISADQRPSYIIVDHPRFASYGEMYVDYYALKGDGRKYSDERNPWEDLDSEFGYPRHTETGRCM